MDYQKIETIEKRLEEVTHRIESGNRGAELTEDTLKGLDSNDVSLIYAKLGREHPVVKVCVRACMHCVHDAIHCVHALCA